MCITYHKVKLENIPGGAIGFADETIVHCETKMGHRDNFKIILP